MQGGTRQVGMREESLLAEMFFVCVGGFYWTSGAGRGHPPAWLSSQKLGRAVALASASRRFGANPEVRQPSVARQGRPAAARYGA